MPPRCTTDIDEAAAALRRGELVAIPTETVYGLAALASQPDSVDQVYALKGRPSSNPLIVHLPNPEHVSNWAAEIPDNAQRLMDAFWPGPLTIVLPARPGVSSRITAGQNTIALRLPAHPLCRSLLEKLDDAVVAPSANRSKSISPTCAEHVCRQFPIQDLLVLDGGACPVGLESTIVSALPGEPARILRPGMIGVDQLEAIVPLADSSMPLASVRVPGQQSRHYAPRTPTLWSSREPSAILLTRTDVGWLNCGAPLVASGPVIDLGNNPDVYARKLYASLYELDQNHLSEIRIVPPPETSAWQAILNRLGRATTIE